MSLELKRTEDDKVLQQYESDEYASDGLEKSHPSEVQPHVSLHSEIMNPQLKQPNDEEAPQHDESDEHATDDSGSSHSSEVQSHASLYSKKNESAQEVPLSNIVTVSSLNPLTSFELSQKGQAAPDTPVFSIRQLDTSQPSSRHSEDCREGGMEEDPLSVEYLTNNGFPMEKDDDQYITRPRVDLWQTKKSDAASEDCSASDSGADAQQQSQFRSGSVMENASDLRGLDGFETSDWNFIADQEDENHAVSVKLDSVSPEVDPLEGQQAQLYSKDHAAAKSIDVVDDHVSSYYIGNKQEQEVVPASSQHMIVSDSEDDNEQARPLSGELLPAGELGKIIPPSMSYSVPEIKTEMVIDFEMALLDNIKQARQEKEREIQEKSGVFFSSVLSRASAADDGKSLASESIASTASKATGFLGLFTKQEFGSKAAFDDNDEGSIESEPGDLLPPPEDRVSSSITASASAIASKEGETASTTAQPSVEASPSSESKSLEGNTRLSTMKRSTNNGGAPFDSESSNDAFVPSSKLAAQMKEFGFDDIFGDEVDLQPPGGSDEEDSNSSDNGSISGLIEEIVKPIASAKPVASSMSTDRTDKQAEADKSYHSDVSSMHDDDNVILASASAVNVSEKESESSESYETDSSEDDGSFKLGPKEAPLLRLENVTAMTRNNIPEDKIAASNKKNSSSWFGWGRKPVGKSPVPSTQGVIRSAPSPSSSQLSSVASSVDSSGQASNSQPSLPPFSSIEMSKPVLAMMGTGEQKKPKKKPENKAAGEERLETSVPHTAQTPPRIELPSKNTVDVKPIHPSNSVSSLKSGGSHALLSPSRKASQHPVTVSALVRNDIKNKSNGLSPGVASLTGDASVVNGGMSTFSGFSGFSRVSGDDKARRKKKKKKGLGEHLGKVRKVSRHGDEISVGTLSKQTNMGASGVQRVVLNTTRDIYGNDDLDGGKRPWESAKAKKRKENGKQAEESPSRKSLSEGFFLDTLGAAGIILEEPSDALEDIDNLSKSEHSHYYVAGATKDGKLLDDFESSSSSDDVSFEKNGWVEDQEADDVENNDNNNMEFDELNAMATLESKLQVETVEVDFDNMWEEVDVDAETALKYEIRKRQKNREKEKQRILKEKEKGEQAVQRLNLFTESGRGKGKAKLTKEFVQAIQSLFDEEDEVAGSSSESERPKQKRIVKDPDDFSIAPSVKSLYMITGSSEAAGKVHLNDSSQGSADDKSKSDSDGGSDSIPNDVRSLTSRRSQQSRVSRSSKTSRSSKSRLDPAAVFESEMRRVKQSKVLSVSTLRQEMSDRRGTSINLIQKEYMTFKKKQHHVDRRQASLNDDSGMDAFQLEGFGMPSGRRGSANSGSFRGGMADSLLTRSLRDEGPIEEKGGLAAHFSRWNQEDGVTSLDDLATVQNSPRAQAGTGIGIAAMAKDLAKIPDSVIDLAQRPVYKMSNAIPSTPTSLATAMTPRKSPKRRTSQSPSPRESPASLPSLSDLNGKDGGSNFPITFNDNHLATIAELEDDDDKLGVFGNTKTLADDDGDRSVVSDKRKKGGFFGKMGMKRTPKNKKGSMQLLGDEQGLLSG